MTESKGGNGRRLQAHTRRGGLNNLVLTKRFYRLATRVPSWRFDVPTWRCPMSAIIYLVGLVVVVMFILSLIGLR
jgi:hypothetical protein